ncbi:MAG: 2,3-bisphosphoglycerate-independent phosphoglycerate mutase [Pseudomonadota bacterium]|nr:MAG: 2,3-bisphosphoglycerate-independent phosphoglycerate mutase [Pseudomonadota bacterium]
MSDALTAPRRSALLVILDGFGVNPSRLNNAVSAAHTPNFDRFFAHYPHTVLDASGHSVGLPDGQMGNSEVGHMVLGSGCIVRQNLVQIDDAITDGSFYKNPALCAAASAAREAGRPVHLMGLVSDGGVHSHHRHLLALIDLCRRQTVTPLLHMMTDGRDTPPRSALAYLDEIEATLKKAGGRIATVSGRYYAMDRDQRWERIELAWRAIVHGVGRSAETAREAIEQAYALGEDDEIILPTVLPGAQPLQPDDAMIFFNFRKDRTRQLTASLTRDDFSGFARDGFEPVLVTCMTEYDQWFDLPYAFEQERPNVTLAELVSNAGLKQFHCAETEKYAHVTFFLNGGRGEAYPGEDRVMIPSPRVATYDLAPEMSAAQVADATIDAMRSGDYALVAVNFANGDMVGHTAVREAIIVAVETLDREVGRVLDQAIAQDYSVVLTADHGNCDEMIDPVTGKPQTQHSVYPVPCLIIDKRPWQLATGGGLGNVAPTILQLMGLPRPEGMHSGSLLVKPLSS